MACFRGGGIWNGLLASVVFSNVNMMCLGIEEVLFLCPSLSNFLSL
jgi:hypothetical protein